MSRGDMYCHVGKLRICILENVRHGGREVQGRGPQRGVQGRSQAARVRRLAESYKLIALLRFFLLLSLEHRRCFILLILCISGGGGVRGGGAIFYSLRILILTA